MTGRGRKCLPDMSEGSFKIHPRVMAALREKLEVYKKLLALPYLSRRIRIDTIQYSLVVKRQEAVFEKRLQKFIENTALGKMYGAWNDNGRLLDY